MSTFTFETYLSMKASAELIGLVGLDGGPVQTQARGLSLEVNNLIGNPFNPTYWVSRVEFLLPFPAIDWVASFETAPGAGDGVFELNTGDPDNPVLLDFEGQFLRAEIGYLLLNFGGLM